MSERLELVSRYFAVLAHDTTLAPEALPGRLTASAAAALGVAGASVSLSSFDLRVPLGASDPEAAVAEQLQFTVGEGPCLDVMRSGRSLACTFDQMRDTWPLFARDLAVKTTYRSIVSVPLPFSARGDGGALDLYSRDTEGVLVEVDEAVATADRIVEVLVGSQRPASLAGADDASKVSWLRASPTRRRMEVWVAMGVVVARTGVDTAGAISLLRRWAWAHDTDVDSVAADIVAGRLDAALTTE